MTPEESMLSQVPCEKQAKMEVPANWFPGWEKVLHPSRPVATVGQAPQASGDSTRRHCHWSSEVRKAQC